MRKSRSSLFLMELIIVIFFFALTSAVCLQVFVKAHDTAKQTEAMNNASLWADNACECFYEYGEDTELIVSTLENAFNSTEYAFDCSFDRNNEFLFMTFTFKYASTGETIYSFTFKKHIQEVA